MNLSRRAVLRGLGGAALALPFLDAMLPRGAWSAGPDAPKRLLTVFFPNGLRPAAMVPATASLTTDTPPYLTPLARHLPNVMLLTGMRNASADIWTPELDNPHGTGGSGALTGEDMTLDGPSGPYAGRSVDQVVADAWSGRTPLRSLELGSEGDYVCPVPCQWTPAISYSGFREPAPPIVGIRAAWQRLTGMAIGEDAADATARLMRRKRIVDAVLPEAKRLSARLGSGDRARMEAWFESVDALEARLQTLSANQPFDGIEAPSEDVDGGGHTETMLDLMVLALQTDQTRVATYAFGREGGRRAYPFLDIYDMQHYLSHHEGRPDLIERLDKVVQWQMGAFAGLLDRLQSTPAEDGTPLWDHTVVYGASAMGEPNIHDITDVSAMLTGGVGALQRGRHVATGGEPLANVCSSLLDLLDLPSQPFGMYGTGSLRSLS
jgi:hypothetical protein